jgi:tRNA threonylcarbamoyladenosine biosynthesis protein TsaB
MIALGFDTATRSTAVALRLGEGRTSQARDDPGPRAHPGHATRLLGMADDLLKEAGIGWSSIQRIAVGVGPGSFTGLRVGVATARGLAQSLGVELVGVSSLRALAEGAGLGADDQSDLAGRGARGVLAVLDARRGEAFAAAYLMTSDRRLVEELVPPRAQAPEDLGGIVARAEARLGAEAGTGAGAGLEAKAGVGGEVPPGAEQAMRWLAIGDGAVRFRGALEDAGVSVPVDSSRLHLLSAEAICELGASGETVAAEEQILPDYVRRPDAEIALEGVGR